ncbi:MAG: TonB-dependent receptor, partial [Cyclobacteriaceae bacterium]
MKSLTLTIGFVLVLSQTFAQTLSGKVFEENGEKALIGVNLYWKNTSKGTVTDTTGFFQLPKISSTNKLVVSYVGYDPVILTVPEDQNYLELTLDQTKTLDEISIVFREKSTVLNTIDPINSHTMTEKELFKAACCNLSESFETNPSVDVAFTDAVTGTKQIEMLGLAGPYTQITVENMPMVRGLATVEGLTYLPGTWMNSIQVTKGSGSVLNGYESIAGQINVEMRKPEDKEILYANAYLNEGGRTEMNLVLNGKIDDEISTGLLLHGAIRPFAMDRNQDTFMDMPTGSNFIGINRWHYQKRGFEAQIGIKGLYFDNDAGQFEEAVENPAQLYTVGMQTKRAEIWGKTGYVFPEKPYQSFGWQWSGTFQDQDYTFGNRFYNGNEKAFYSNLIFQSILGNTNHVYKLGFSYLYDEFDESLDGQDYDRRESVPGLFAE